MYIHNYIFAEEVVFNAVNLLFVLAVSRGNYCNYRGSYDKKKIGGQKCVNYRSKWSITVRRR